MFPTQFKQRSSKSFDPALRDAKSVDSASYVFFASKWICLQGRTWVIALCVPGEEKLYLHQMLCGNRLLFCIRCLLHAIVCTHLMFPCQSWKERCSVRERTVCWSCLKGRPCWKLCLLRKFIELSFPSAQKEVKSSAHFPSTSPEPWISHSFVFWYARSASKISCQWSRAQCLPVSKVVSGSTLVTQPNLYFQTWS